MHGVGFRFFVQEAAKREGLRGWVRNLPDGRVEVFAEGDEESVHRLEGQIRRGPRPARVEHVDVESEIAAGLEKDFEIR